MKVAIDLTGLLPHPAGVDNYLLGLVSSLARLDHDTTYIVFVNVEDRARLERQGGDWPDPLPDNFRLVSVSLQGPRRLPFAVPEMDEPYFS